MIYVTCGYSREHGGERATEVIEFVLVCFGFLALMAVVVPIVDAVRTTSLRTAASERRARWHDRRAARRAGAGVAPR